LHLPPRRRSRPFSAARQSGIPATRAVVTPRAFGCGCAAL